VDVDNRGTLTTNRPACPRWRVAAASVRGTSHEKLGTVCQDASFWQVAADNTLIAAVADGAGSATHGHVGARLAARSAVETLRAHPDLASLEGAHLDAARPVLEAALLEARHDLIKEAHACGLKPRDLATTLILVAASTRGIAGAQIGDGAAVIQTESGNLIALTTPDTGEYTNETTFLVSPGALERAQYFACIEAPGRLALFTDGLQRMALQMPFGRPHAPFFNPLFQFISKADEAADDRLASFLQSPRVKTRSDDDLTLLLAALTDPAHESEHTV
jgi:serine/threonine protein phosphatase PrpC